MPQANHFPESRIELISELKLAGKHHTMSYAADTTALLWRSFMPGRKAIGAAVGTGLYSIEIYPGGFFENFDPTRKFEKWAAVGVSDFNNLPPDVDSLLLPAGLYASFVYRGRPQEVSATYAYILGNWMPRSGYRLDDRPHFAVMGERYKGDDPESEEELWVPVR